MPRSSNVLPSQPRSIVLMPQRFRERLAASTTERISALSLRNSLAWVENSFCCTGHNLVAIGLSRGHVHQPIARTRLARATIPDRRQMVHLLGILFANAAQVQRQRRVLEMRLPAMSANLMVSSSSHSA